VIHSIDDSGTSFTLLYQGQSIRVKTPLLGKFNVANHLAAAGFVSLLVSTSKLLPRAYHRSMQSLVGSKKVPSQSGFTVLVDFAHTDDALDNVLSTLKPLCKARLIVVFGCGGDRDKTKRPRMAKVVEKYADIAIVTSDNPRTENPDDIISQVVAGFKDPGSPKNKNRTRQKKSDSPCYRISTKK